MQAKTVVIFQNMGQHCGGKKKKEATQTSENKMVNIRLHKFRLLHTVLLNQLQEDYNI